MPIDQNPKPKPINTHLFGATLFGGASYALWSEQGPWQMNLLAGFLALNAFGLSVSGGQMLVQDFKTRIRIKKSLELSEDHGSAREATWDEIIARGMTDPNSGPLYGFKDGRPVFAPPDAIFCAVEMPPGVGKSSKLVIGSILHNAMLGKSILVPDVKGELAASVVPFLKRQGISVLCINPTGLYCDEADDA